MVVIWCRVVEIKMNEEQLEPIQQLFVSLHKELQSDHPRSTKHLNVTQLITNYLQSGHQDYKEYMHFNPHNYSRNLVNKNELLELMVICWESDQKTPIHNHAGQDCWASVLEGTIEEIQYHFKNTKKSVGTGPLEVSHQYLFYPGEVSYISDDIALHLVQPCNSQRAVTLHLYSKPICECSIYCPNTGQITKRKVGYYTVNKMPQETFIINK